MSAGSTATIPAGPWAGRPGGGVRLVPAHPGAAAPGAAVRWARRRWLALAATAIALPIAVATVRGTFEWCGRPFPGFFAMGNAVVPTVGAPGWTGLEAGVPFHARVLAVDGVPVATNGDLDRAVTARPIGTVLEYTLRKDGRTFTRSAPTMRFRLRDYWATVGLMSAFGVVSLVMGIGVVLLQPRRRSAHAFLWMQLLTALYALTGTALYHPGLQALSRLHFVTQATFPAAFIHLALTFPVERRFVERHPAWLAAPYMVGLALAAWVLVDFYAETPSTVPLYATYLYAALSIVLQMAIGAYAYWEARTPRVRPQLRVVLPGLVVGTAVGLYGYLDNVQGGGRFPISFVALTPLVFYASVAHAIVRWDLFDIDTLVRRGLLYLIMTAAVTGGYAGTLTLLAHIRPLAQAGGSPLFNLAFVTLMAFGFQSLRARVQRGIDRAFFRNRPDFARTVRAVAADLASELDLGEILTRVGRAVQGTLAVESTVVALWAGTGCRVWRLDEAVEAVVPDSGPGWDAVRTAIAGEPRRAWPLLVDPDDEDEDGAAVAIAGAPLAGAALLLPLAVGEETLGVVALGPRRSGEPFRRPDLELLDTLAAQAAVAIQNALSVEALRRLAGELEVRVAARTAALAASNAELDRAYRDLKAAQAQALQSEKLASLGQLVAGVAHEINNPVSFIVGNVEPVQRRLDDLAALADAHGDEELQRLAQRVRRMFAVIKEGAERTAGIVNDLRTFSRVGDELARPTDVHDGLEVTLRLLRPRWSDRITIHRDFGPLPPVAAAPGQLNQVFMNLIANACDAIAGSGNVWVATRAEDGWARITVRDDGRGIAPEHLPHVFEPFFTTKPQGEGTGLGLAISYGIVTQHGGRLEVASRLGTGTTFVVHLPVEGREPAADAETSPAPEPDPCSLDRWPA